MFLVSDLQLHWHPQGDFLSVEVERFAKNKKSTYNTLEVLSMREKAIPIDVFEGFKQSHVLAL